MQRNEKLKQDRTSKLATLTPPKFRGPAAHEPPLRREKCEAVHKTIWFTNPTEGYTNPGRQVDRATKFSSSD